MDLAPYLPRKESKVLDLSFTRVSPSSACCHRCGGGGGGGTSSHSHHISASSHQWWRSIFNPVSSLSQPNDLTKSDKRPDPFSQIWVSSLGTF